MKNKKKKYFDFLGAALNVNFALAKKEKDAETKNAIKLDSD